MTWSGGGAKITEMKRYTVGAGMIGLVLLACAAAYWASAKYSAERFLAALAARDTTALNAELDWEQLLPAVAKDVATSFPDPNARNLSSLIEATYKNNFLRIVRTSKAPIHALYSGFTNVDEYTVITSSGNRWIFRRHGVRWVVDRLEPTPENAVKIAIVAIATADPDATLNILARDIYFGRAEYGCRLTATADVTSFDASPPLIAYVRTVELAHTQLWLLHEDTFKNELAVDGKQKEQFSGPSTEGQRSLTFSADGHYLYFAADAWTTSGVIVELDINTRKTRFVEPGNLVQAIGQGKYAGNLLVVQNRHHPPPEFGLYEQAVVIDRQGKELAYVDGPGLTTTFDHDKHELLRNHQIDEERSMPELLRVANDAQ